MKQDILIYEYRQSFFIIERSQQGKGTDIQTEYQRASENVNLQIELSKLCTHKELGEATVEALNKFDKTQPKHNPWELKKLNKQLCSWLKCRSINALNKNSRLVQVIRTESQLIIIPFDNHNKYPWYAPMNSEDGYKDKITNMKLNSLYEEIGCSIIQAFEHSTYNPERSDEK